jgi:hypothetical protein
LVARIRRGECEPHVGTGLAVGPGGVVAPRLLASDFAGLSPDWQHHDTAATATAVEAKQQMPKRRTGVILGKIAESG